MFANIGDSEIFGRMSMIAPKEVVVGLVREVVRKAERVVGRVVGRRGVMVVNVLVVY